jgi:transglutaminase-like putative cysteine protease
MVRRYRPTRRALDARFVTRYRWRIMRCAPYVGLTGSMVAAPSGVAGIYHTLRLMRGAIRAGKVDPRIIEAATQLIYTTPAKAEFAEVDAIYSWVRDHVRYVRDVAGVETLANPWTTFQRQSGDCDDQIALLGALLESVGYAVRLVIAAYQVPGQWEHVYLQVLANGAWIDADPTEDIPLGASAAGAASVWIEPV